MDEEIIDIDGEVSAEAPIQPTDFHATPDPSTASPQIPASNARPMTAAAQLAATSMLTRRSNRSTTTPPVVESSDRTMRSATQHTRPRFQPKLKLKVNERQASGTSFLGPYDRELDSDDEDLTFEEQFILRMPPGEDCERLRSMIESRDVPKDVWFKFKGRRMTCPALCIADIDVFQTLGEECSTSEIRHIPRNSSTCHASSRRRKRSTIRTCSKSPTFAR